jgi:hypothetical protein
LTLGIATFAAALLRKSAAALAQKQERKYNRGTSALALVVGWWVGGVGWALAHPTQPHPPTHQPTNPPTAKRQEANVELILFYKFKTINE